MKELQLIPHGDYVKPQYRPRKGQTQSWAGQSTDAQRKGGSASGIVERYAKKKSASATPLAFGWIGVRYRSGIQYLSGQAATRGLSMAIGVMGAIIMGGAGLNILLVRSRYFDTFDAVWGSTLVAFGLGMVFWTSRLELFCPEDQPTIFDRANRKVYRIFRESYPGLVGLLRPWPLRACEYDWDLLDAEHNARVVSTGSTVARRHTLVFIVRRSASDPTIIDSFNIGNSLTLGEQTVPGVWEHIRRFMEEKGPHLPPGEPLAAAQAPTTLWRCMGASGPIGPNYFKWWREESGYMLIAHAMFFLFGPLHLFAGISAWLSVKTARPIRWPQAVIDAVGVPLNEDGTPAGAVRASTVPGESQA